MKENLKTKHHEEFLYNTYLLNHVITFGSHSPIPKTNEKYLGIYNEKSKLFQFVDNRYRGFYYEVDANLIKKPESFREYILSLDPDSLYENDLPYYHKFIEKYKN